MSAHFSHKPAMLPALVPISPPISTTGSPRGYSNKSTQDVSAAFSQQCCQLRSVATTFLHDSHSSSFSPPLKCASAGDAPGGSSVLCSVMCE
eukprot:8255062-Heterocapsa_arctica.AAC.1